LKLLKYKSEIIVGLGVVLAVMTFVLLFEVVAPFLLALILAFASLPAILLIKKLFKNQQLSIAVFLISLVAAMVVAVLVLAGFINRDFNRLNNGLKNLAAENEESIDQYTAKAKEYLSTIFSSEQIEGFTTNDIDSLMNSVNGDETSKLDMDAIKDGFASITSFFQSDAEQSQQAEESSSIGFWGILFASIGYYVLILFNINYFISLRSRYLGNKLKGRMQQVYEDFNSSFFRYFRLRTRIVLLLALLYLATFIILDMPGLILLMIFIVLLSYIPYLQYLMLIPAALGCFILSMESDHSFLLYFGVVTGVFVLASIIEEVWLTPKIMEGNMGLNPAIMVLALSIGSYTFGLPGLLLGIPLTSFLIIYMKRYFLQHWQEKMA